MHRSTLAAALGALVGFACGDQQAPVATEEPAGLEATTVLSACDGDLATRINQQIVLLFPKGKSLRQAAQSQFDNIVRKCPRAEAQAQAIELVGFTNTKWREGKLTPGTTQAAVAVLLNDVLAFVGLASEIPAGALGPAGVVAVIGPSTETQTVATGDRQAGASFPPGAVSLPVVVAIAPSTDQTDPLPTVYPQVAPFYDFVTSPAVTFGQPVTIGVCVNYGNASPEVVARLQLARPDVTGGTTLELLPRVPPPPLAGCNPIPGLSAAAGTAQDGGLVQRLFATARMLLRPAALYARSVPLVQFDPIGGLGGTVGNFGDNPTGTVDPLPGQIAYVTSDWVTSTFDEIHVINTDGTGDTRLTNDPGRHDRYPAWSPDGGRIAFVAYPVQCDSEGATVGCEAVHVMNADGSAVVRVLWEWEHGSTELNSIRDVDWIADLGEPNDHLLGFTAGADHPRGECIYQTDLNRAAPWGGGVTSVLSDSDWREWLGAEGECLLSSTAGWDLQIVDVDWGQDSTFVMAGRRIDYEVCDSGGVSYRCNASEGPVNLFTSTWTGYGLQSLAMSPADLRAPTWSPDGTRIAFVEVIAGSSRGDVMVLEVASGVVVRLTADGMAEPSALTWSPDGTKLAFARLQAAPVHCAGPLIADIYVISAVDGSSPVNVTNSDPALCAWNWAPDWRPEP